MTATAEIRAGLLLVGVLILLFLTNPDKKRFDSFIVEHIAHTQGKHSIGRAFMNSIGPVVIDNASTRRNFGLFSVYRLDSVTGGMDREFLGILHVFIPLP
jgi:hypothetical protein